MVAGRGLDELRIPLHLAELLHATLGPLCEVLDSDEHDWVPMIRRVLSEYVSLRDQHLVALYGPGVTGEICKHSYNASEMVCALTRVEIAEAKHFVQWDVEFKDETA